MKVDRESLAGRLSLGGLILFILIPGCNSIWNGFLDPTQVGRFSGPPLTLEIKKSISIADEPIMEMIPEASEPTEEDLKVADKDYVLRPGDIIDLSIYELLAPGIPWIQTRQISREGYITIPQVKQDIKAAGKTARELQKYIAKILQAEQILTNPDVTVVLREPRSMVYNILGAVNAPGANIIPRPDFRILDALAAAGGIAMPGGAKQPLIKTIYVFRKEDYRPKEDKGKSPTDKSAQIALTATDQSLSEEGYWIWADGEWKFIKPTEAEAKKAEEAKGKVPTEEAEETSKPSASTQPSEEAEPADSWQQIIDVIPSQRIIAIPVDKLESGDPRYNIVIREGDTIWVPPATQGEFYVMGNVLRPGVYSLTGRHITLKQAIAAAGGLGPIADPSRCELIRRIGDDKEQVITIDLDKIFAGKEPDIILKPDDIINVGTNPIMPFLAVLRNAFRATYGFGFVYDRNFADIDSYYAKPNPAAR